jgi:NTP pyrophosphatase (non-canonical NTP hydrolase)
MTTGFDEFDSRIRDLAERENECDCLFEEIRKGNGEKSLRYIALRDSCKELRKEIFRSAMTAGLTRERIKTEIGKARNQTTNASRLRKDQ